MFRSFVSPNALSRPMSAMVAVTLVSLLQACGGGGTPDPEPGVETDPLLSAPLAVRAQAEVGAALVSWKKPAETGGGEITEYTVSTLPEGPVVTVAGTETVALVGELARGSSYTFTVRAKTSAGFGPASGPSATIRTPDVPKAPRGVSAKGGAGSATVSWAAPDDGGRPIDSYTVTATPGGATASVDGQTTTAMISGLSDRTSYTFAVVATNAVGAGAPSTDTASAITFSTPAAPTRVSATRGNGELTVSWFAPSNDGGTPITGFKVVASPGNQTLDVDAGISAVVVPNLVNGTPYTFRVIAVNELGDSAPSDPSAPIEPATPPGSPTAVTATTNLRREAVVSWTAPTQTGGIAISGYRVTSSPGGFGTLVSGTSTSAVVTGLSNGIEYTFTVQAVNEVGASDPSAPSNPVTTYNVPDAPTNVAGTLGDKQVDVSWTAPASNGGSAIASYVVTAAPGGQKAVVAPPATSATVSGLTNGVSYTFTVVAHNSAGASAPSAASDPVSPGTLPSAPTAVKAVAGANGEQATVSWTAANDGGRPIQSYLVTASPGGQTATVGGTQTSAVVPGLQRATSYTFTVVATTSLGSSPASAPSTAITTPNLPAKPTITNAVAGNGQVTVSYSAPNNGGSTITEYIVTASPGGTTRTVTGTTLSAVVTGLTNGTPYTFTLVARNGVGDSPASEPSSEVTPATAPDAPTDVVATAGIRSATVTWVAPANNGGSPITGYVVRNGTSSTNLATVDGTTTTVTVTGLANGTKYNFNVRAVNAAGTGAASANAPEITTPALPGAPTAVAATPGNAQATVSWTAPTSDGGKPITGYKVISSPATTTVEVTGTATSVVFPGLTNGTSYKFQVSAVTDVGEGAKSAAMANGVVPATVPDAPTAVSALPSKQSATVKWTLPASNGGSAITSFTATSNPGNISATVNSATATSVSVTGLANGTTYTFTVVAKNAVGSSAPSEASAPVTTFDVASAPQGVIATEGNAQATINWVIPSSNGGTPITGYKVTTSPADVPVKTVTGGSTTQTTVTGLTNGTLYSFTVVAVNFVGDSASSDPSNPVIPSGPPAAPETASATAGVEKATVTWTAPLSDGGSPLTGYTVTASPGGAVQNVDASVLTTEFTGLTGGTSYTFAVVAKNVNGNSPARTTAAVTVQSVPGTVGNLAASGSDGTLQVTWSAPSNTGGSAISSYTVTVNPGAIVSSVPGSETSATINNLSSGASYDVEVTATNATGTGLPATTSSVVVCTSPTFSLSQSPATGVLPSRAVAADFNGDGNLDLAVTNETDDTVSVLLGAGDGTFAAKVDYVTGDRPSAIASADVNLDGNKDLLVVNRTAGSLSVLLGSANGTFGTRQDVAIGGDATSLSVGDFTSDGNVDVVIGSLGTGNVELLVGSSTGAFTLGTGRAVTGTPTFVTTGEVTGDTHLDLIVATSTPAVLVFAGLGDGTFGNPFDLGITAAADFLAVGRIDGDTRGDIVVNDTATAQLTVIRSGGAGTFLTPASFSAASTANGLVIADFDRDGKNDVAASNTAGGFSRFPGLGTGAMGTRQDFTSASTASALVTADFNKDGNPDVALVLPSSNTLGVQTQGCAP